MSIHEFRCFGRAPGEGNAALVIENDGGGAAARQAFAAASGRSACVFIDAPTDPRDAATLDYFYPHTRSPLCLHATLAAAALLFERDGKPVTVTTAMHGQRLQLRHADGVVFVGLTRQPVPPVAVDDALVQRLMRASGSAQVASVGSPKLMVQVADWAALEALSPDLEAILAWGRAHGVNGCYAWCRLADGELAGRNFNHLPGAPEDSATGVAAGALAALLGHDLRLRQGPALSCLIHVRVDGERIDVGGAAERVTPAR